MTSEADWACSSIGVLLSARAFYVSKPDTTRAQELGVKCNRLGGCTLPWEDMPQHA